MVRALLRAIGEAPPCRTPRQRTVWRSESDRLHLDELQGPRGDAAARGVGAAFTPTRNGSRRVATRMMESGLEPGDNLGIYRIERPLGRGGMGAVFLAHDTVLRRDVALKVLGASADEGRDQLLREARNAAALNHPSICTIYEVGDANGRAFIAMEFIDGQPVSERLAESALSLDEAVRYGIEAADALAYAH